MAEDISSANGGDLSVAVAAHLWQEARPTEFGDLVRSDR